MILYYVDGGRVGTAKQIIAIAESRYGAGGFKTDEYPTGGFLPETFVLEVPLGERGRITVRDLSNGDLLLEGELVECARFALRVHAELMDSERDAEILETDAEVVVPITPGLDAETVVRHFVEDEPNV